MTGLRRTVALGLLCSVYMTTASLNSIKDRCCSAGKSWFVQSRERCGTFTTTVRGVPRKEQVGCAALAQVCCLQQKGAKQCLQGKQVARIQQRCTSLQSRLGNERARECCSCCRLGQVASASGQSCDLELFNGTNPACGVVLYECCRDARPSTTPPALQTQLPQRDTATDVDECAMFPQQLCAHVCVNTPGSYRCECHQGFTLSPDGRSCHQQRSGNRCDNYNPCDHECVDTGLAVHCKCFTGFVLAPDERKCEDINECSLGTHTCHSGERCVNTDGSYICQPAAGRLPGNPRQHCSPGYAYNRLIRECQDIDECTVARHTCALTEECVNTAGSYRCLPRQNTTLCGPGYRYDKVTERCEDVNECVSSSVDACGPGQTCENTAGSFYCRRTLGCGTGYTLDRDTQICVDDDECQLGTHNCGMAYACRNIKGSFRCDPKTCPRGYKLDYRNGQCGPIVCNSGFKPSATGTCVDVNECLSRPSVCLTNQKCRNTIGSYKCMTMISCGPGFELDARGFRCVDIDECTRNTHECRGRNQQCVNRPGTYLCQCPAGFRMNHRRRVCEDVNECGQYGGHVCSQNSECVNTDGSFSCRCRAGFTSASGGRICNDIDECKQKGLCQHTCRNTWGSYQCTCFNGYRLAADKRMCVDIDECAMWTGRPSRLCVGLCTNTPGSYTCACPQGYRMLDDGHTCQDIDECATRTANCDGPDDICINTRGGFKCRTVTCPFGFVKAPSYGNRNNNVRCQRRTFVCSHGDEACFTAPLTFSYNFITFPAQIRVPADLFTMRGPASLLRRLDFSLHLNQSRDPHTGESRVSRDMFRLRQVARNEAVVQLLQRVRGAQDVTLELRMRIYSKEFQNAAQEMFYGTVIAQINLFVTADPWLDRLWATTTAAPPVVVMETTSLPPQLKTQQPTSHGQPADRNATSGRYRNYVRSLLGKPRLITVNLNDTGVVCQRLECSQQDFVCLLNKTKSIQYQQVALPALSHVTEPVVVLNIQTIGYRVYPNLLFTMETGNVNGTFSVNTDPRYGDRGTLEVVKPIAGPLDIQLKIRMDNRNAYNYIVTSHYAIVDIFISEFNF